MRYLRYVQFIGLVALLAVAAVPPVRAQQATQAAKPAPAGTRIVADSASYRIEWNGTSGVFILKPFGQEPESRQPLAFLHTDAGPTGFATHLAWFLARNGQAFSLLWCYL